ncbi:MAG: UMP kinase [Proteobacteria bacterium]|nr:UMP kinase [Pseudomonadota bacterium]
MQSGPVADETIGSAHYKRVLLKLSGEALMGQREFGLDPETVGRITSEVRHVAALGIQVCLVIGAGNLFRGVTAAAGGIERTTADYMGMIATVINALAIQSALEAKGVQTRVQSAIPMTTVCEPYVRRRAVRHMEKGRVVIFAGGTGNPFFTTDTAAALRAVEMGCDIIMKGTQVDGVYSADPRKDKTAVRYDRLSYQDVLARNLKVMDTTAVALARDNRVPILVFSLHNAGAFADAVCGRGTFTIIGDAGGPGHG